MNTGLLLVRSSLFEVLERRRKCKEQSFKKTAVEVRERLKYFPHPPKSSIPMVLKREEFYNSPSVANQSSRKAARSQVLIHHPRKGSGKKRFLSRTNLFNGDWTYLSQCQAGIKNAEFKWEESPYKEDGNLYKVIIEPQPLHTSSLWIYEAF